MFLKKTRLAAALLGTIATFAVSISAAHAESIGTLKIDNKSGVQANYNASGSNCFASVVPSFSNIAIGVASTFTAKSSTTAFFSCKVAYDAGTKHCTFLVTRQQTQTCNPFTGICTTTWNYPTVTLPGSTSGCASAFTSVSDTNAVVTPTNGAFAVTLTVK